MRGLSSHAKLDKRRKPLAICLNSLEELQYVGSFIFKVLFHFKRLVRFWIHCDKVGDKLKVIYNTSYSLVNSQAQAAQKDTK